MEEPTTFEVRVDRGVDASPRHHIEPAATQATLIATDADGDEFHLNVEASDSGFVFSDSGGNMLDRLELWDARDN